VKANASVEVTANVHSDAKIAPPEKDPTMDLDTLGQRLRRHAPDIAFWSARLIDERSEQITVRRDVAEAPTRSREAGVMVMVNDGAGTAHAATSDLSDAGLRDVFARAVHLAEATRGRHLTAEIAASMQRPPPATWRHAAAVQRPVAHSTLTERLDRVAQACARIRPDSGAPDSRLVDWSATLWTTQREQLYIDGDGLRQEQAFSYVVPNLLATAQAASVTQTRSAAGLYNGYCQQGGLEVLERAHFDDDGPRVAREAIELSLAAPCPSGSMPVLLMPDQMMLQIHESIGHPLELDRILGDERNFAGTSFVTLDLFGHYQWGSPLLNVSHDPSRSEQLASAAADDEGLPSERVLLIEAGILKRPLGGALSAARARRERPDIMGVATARSSDWNRAPIDRMSNLNIEPGTSTLDEMIGSIEFGVLMKTNRSWSIDDSRNKFQFGCEFGQVIRHGRLAEVVRNPSYRGVSATFWRSLAMVGNADTFEIMGTPFCGKGEPSQVVRVGHASPACLFHDVAVFSSGA
jgi:predicted Zn-dependent protease